jgi:hypothetical protein
MILIIHEISIKIQQQNSHRQEIATTVLDSVAT